MKQLNKRYKRNFISNLSFYISIAILTALAVILYLGLAGSYDEEQRYIDNVRTYGNIESGQFVTYNEITEDDIKELEKEFDIDLENQLYYDADGVNDDGEDTIRLLRPTDKINRYTVSEGEDVTSDSDILLNPLYAQTQGISIGDSVTIGKKTYTLKGYCIRPDYLFCLRTLSDTYSESDRFGIGIITKEAFDELNSEDCSSIFSVVYHKDNEKDVRKAIYDRYLTAQYISEESNNRIATPKDELASIKSIRQIVLPVMVIAVMLLAAVVLGRKIRNEQKMIGILNALGYRKSEIALHYSIFGAIPGLIGSIIGVCVSIPLASKIIDICFGGKVEPCPIDTSISAKLIVFSLAVPAICYVAAVFLSALKSMHGDTVDMIHGNADSKGRNRLRLKNSKLKIRTKFRLRAILGSIPRTLIVVFGIALGGLMLSFCYACVDSLDVYVNSTVDDIGDFEYEYYLNKIQTDEPEYGEPLVCGTFGVEGCTDLLTLTGSDTDNPYMNYRNTNGDPITLKKGKYYISDMASNMYGVNGGDNITFFNTASLKTYTVPVEGVIKNAAQSVLISDRDTITELLELPQGCYNFIMSDKALNYSSSELIKTIVKSDYKEQIRENVLVMMESFIGVCIVLGILISVIAIYLMVNILLTENATSISMMKVLGFYDKEVNGMVTHIYHFLVPIGILLGLVLGYYMNKVNFINSTEAYNTYIEAHMTAASVIKYVFVITLSYVISFFLLKRKTSKVSMVESLKNNRE